MKKKFFFAVPALAFTLAFTGCSKDDAQQVSVDVESIPATQAQMTKQIVVSSNTPWTTSGQTAWCRVSPESGQKGETQVTVTVDANNEYDSRTTTLVFAGSEAQSKGVVVTQSQKDAVTLEKKDYDFDFKGGKLDVTPQSNVDFTANIVLKAGEDPWIKQVESRAMAGKALYFDVAKNLTGAARTGKIEMKDAQGNVLLTLNVTQSADGTIDFPDADFKAILVENYDTDSDGEISLAEAKEITLLDVRDKALSSVEGIEYMASLKTLYADYNNLAALDLSSCPDIESVSIQGQGSRMSDSENLNPTLTSLKVDKCTKLESLDSGFNPLLKTLDISKNEELTYLNCSECGLTALDVAKNTKLTEMYCSTNDITVLDLSQNRLLQSLTCMETKLTTLDVSACTGMTFLNIRSNPDLAELWLQTNQSISTLRKGSNTELKYK